MRCKVCGNEKYDIIYDGIIRDGAVEQYTEKPVKIFQCCECKVIWHDVIKETTSYYESEEYRNSLDGAVLEDVFYRTYDRENFDKLKYTGTTLFRGKNVCDVGCGAGAFLDYVSGQAKNTIAVEPSETFRKILDKKGFNTYNYANSAYGDWSAKIDVMTSFDVIEHVEEPEDFIRDFYILLKDGGVGIIGTPTDAPIMRSLLGSDYEKKLLFSTQHIWILNEESMKIMAERAGFKANNISFKYYQRYGLGNCFGWMKERRARATIDDEFVTSTMDAVWKSEIESQGLSDYIVMYLQKRYAVD